MFVATKLTKLRELVYRLPAEITVASILGDVIDPVNVSVSIVAVVAMMDGEVNEFVNVSVPDDMSVATTFCEVKLVDVIIGLFTLIYAMIVPVEICDATIEGAVAVPPTVIFFVIPTPPYTINAPVEVEDEFAVFCNITVDPGPYKAVLFTIKLPVDNPVALIMGLVIEPVTMIVPVEISDETSVPVEIDVASTTGLRSELVNTIDPPEIFVATILGEDIDPDTNKLFVVSDVEVITGLIIDDVRINVPLDISVATILGDKRDEVNTIEPPLIVVAMILGEVSELVSVKVPDDISVAIMLGDEIEDVADNDPVLIVVAVILGEIIDPVRLSVDPEKLVANTEAAVIVPPTCKFF
jgi:hypothetical protein